MDGIPAISEEVMGLVYGRKLGKNDPVFFPKCGLLPWGWQEDQFLKRCLVWRGDPVFQISLSFQFGVKQRGQDC